MSASLFRNQAETMSSIDRLLDDHIPDAIAHHYENSSLIVLQLSHSEECTRDIIQTYSADAREITCSVDRFLKSESVRNLLPTGENLKIEFLALFSQLRFLSCIGELFVQRKDGKLHRITLGRTDKDHNPACNGTLTKAEHFFRNEKGRQKDFSHLVGKLIAVLDHTEGSANFKMTPKRLLNLSKQWDDFRVLVNHEVEKPLSRKEAYSSFSARLEGHALKNPEWPVCLAILDKIDEFIQKFVSNKGKNWDFTDIEKEVVIPAIRQLIALLQAMYSERQVSSARPDEKWLLRISCLIIIEFAEQVLNVKKSRKLTLGNFADRLGNNDDSAVLLFRLLEHAGVLREYRPNKRRWKVMEALGPSGIEKEFENHPALKEYFRTHISFWANLKTSRFRNCIDQLKQRSLIIA